MARGQGLDRVPDDVTAEHLKLFRNAVNVGLSQVSRLPGAKAKQHPGRLLLECLQEPRSRRAAVPHRHRDTADGRSGFTLHLLGALRSIRLGWLAGLAG